jgi:Nucleotidyltransferase of unknown function (DUF6036)
MKPDTIRFQPDPQFAQALADLLARVAEAVGAVKSPVKLCIAGGTALHLYTGSRYSADVDAKVFARIALPGDDLQVFYSDSSGRTRLLYFDTQYNDSFALLHGDAYDEAIPVAVQSIDPKRLAVHVLSPLDLAVSKVARFTEQDRADIVSLARAGLLDATAFRQRAEEALGDFVGNLETLKGHLRVALKDVEVNSPSSSE